MKLTILCNNSVNLFSGCTAEHGFSAFIETAEGNYLFDTGRGLGVARNAMLLGKDLRSIRAIVLSHGHNDHTGGLEQVLTAHGAPIPVHLHEDAFALKFRNDARKPFIGVPFRREYLEGLGARFVFNKEFKQIADDLFVTGEIPRKNDFERPSPGLLTKDATGAFVVDPLLDDNSLAIRTQKGVVLLLGCAHAGVVNIMDHVAASLHTDSIYAVIGGTHLAKVDAERMAKTVAAFERRGVAVLSTCHCTGLEKGAELRAHFGSVFSFAQVGTEFVFE